jgi:NAD(P)H-flavin reductase
MLPRRFRARKVVRELADTYTLHLEPEEGEPLRFVPGQFSMLYAFGVGEIAISISGDPEKPEGLVHTIRGVGPVSRALCATRRGAVIGVRGPFGAPWPVSAAEGRDLVIMAGGLGLAPLRPALYHALAHRERYGKVALLVGARTPKDLLFTREMERWRSRFDLEVEVTVDSAGPEWKGNVGVVTTLLPRVGFEPANTVAMVCGPEIMMRYGAAELCKRGVPAEHVYLSMERNMKCAVGFCGHCQLGPVFVCKDGPVFPYPAMEPYFRIREV